MAYAPLIERRLRAFRQPHCGSIRVDETYIKIRGQWRYLYCAIDKHGTPTTPDYQTANYAVLVFAFTVGSIEKLGYINLFRLSVS